LNAHDQDTTGGLDELMPAIKYVTFRLPALVSLTLPTAVAVY
jgi:hypothetical protein